MIDKKNIKLGLDITKINHIISRTIDNAIFESVGDKITLSQAYVIEFIHREGENRDIFQKDLEKEFDLKRSSVSLLLNNMEKSDLIKRYVVKEDARLKKIVLTKKAIKINEKISSAIDLIESKISKDLTIDEIKTFYNIIYKIRKTIE